MRESRRLRRFRKQTVWRLVAVTSLLATALVAWLSAPASAATSFASPLFQAQWQAGEAITPNFWGPLSLAHDGQQEPYVEAPGGQRLVQYFDKARMELTNPATNTVTNGLLATELITGRMQLGDNTFQQLTPAAVPVAGDPDNIGPTYASIAANSTTLLANATSAPGTQVSRQLSATGALGTYSGASASDPQAVIAAFDADTQHNVPKAFADYRTKAGLLTIGFAISEAFWSNVKVAGQQKDVLVQAFQRRVLTYTPTNPAAFQVEMGNIGIHYYTWRYLAPTATPTPTGPTATPTVVAGTDTTPPKFTSAPKVEYMTPYSFALSWTTNEPASSEVKYGTSANYEGINDKQKGIFSTDHYVVVSGLTPSGGYHYRIQSRDPAGNLTVDDQDRGLTLPAVPASLMMSGITPAKPTATTFTVNWTTTIACTARVEYGKTNGVYDRWRKGTATAGTAQTATAISLEPNSVYFYRVVSTCDTGGGNIVSIASDEGASPLPNPTIPTGAEVAALNISNLTATQDAAGHVTHITFSTDRPASVIIEIGSTNKLGGGFIYGPMADYPYPFTRNLHDISYAFPPGTWYYRVAVYDEQGTRTSDIKTVTVT